MRVQRVEYTIPLTWGRCNRCRFSFFDPEACIAQPALNQEIFPCVRRQFTIFDSSVWAAQLSWWLQFYAPEDLFLTTTEALLDPEKRMHVRSPPRHNPLRSSHPPEMRMPL